MPSQTRDAQPDKGRASHEARRLACLASHGKASRMQPCFPWQGMLPWQRFMLPWHASCRASPGKACSHGKARMQRASPRTRTRLASKGPTTPAWAHARHPSPGQARLASGHQGGPRALIDDSDIHGHIQSLATSNPWPHPILGRIQFQYTQARLASASAWTLAGTLPCLASLASALASTFMRARQAPQQGNPSLLG